MIKNVLAVALALWMLEVLWFIWRLLAARRASRLAAMRLLREREYRCDRARVNRVKLADAARQLNCAADHDGGRA